MSGLAMLAAVVMMRLLFNIVLGPLATMIVGHPPALLAYSEGLFVGLAYMRFDRLLQVGDR